ncbi:MAG: amidohydrolase family protein [Elusimicrobia bacterium]|nr:amidohydrolase family protein [Elusimicrobiota bacterium]
MKAGNMLIKDGKVFSFPNNTDNLSKIKTIDARGLICMPGIVDIHTHFRLKLGEHNYNSDDFESGTKAALSCGITCVADFTDQDPGDSFLSGIKKRIKDAKKSYCDYSFHCIVPSFSKMKNFSLEVKKAADSGAFTFKIFTAYSKRGLMLSSREIRQMLKEAKRNKAAVFVHAEKEEDIEKNSLKYANLKKKNPMKAFPFIRSEVTELNAVKEVIKLNEDIKAKLYFVHISSPLSAAEIKKASERMPVRAETCPQYLIFSDKIYSKKDAYLYSCCPPVRSPNASLKLWDFLNKGVLSAVSTDSCGFSVKMKKSWGGDLDKLYMGISSAQFLFPLIYTFGVRKKRITLERLKALCCENPAKFAGFSKKGFLKKGYDADFFLFDPKECFFVSKKSLLNSCGYSVYEGFKLWGKVKKVFLRGKIAYDGGKVFKPMGAYVKRTPPFFNSR